MSLRGGCRDAVTGRGDRQIADVARSLSSSETKCDELESRVTANTDSVGLKLAQDADAIVKSINRSLSSASEPFATNIVQTEKIHEVPFTGAATSDTWWVK